MGANRIVTGRRALPGGMLRECSAPGCATLTLGELCLAHDVPVVMDLPRGVPHRSPVPASMQDAWTPVADPRLVRA